MEKNIYLTFDKRYYSCKDVINGKVHLETKTPLKIDYIEVTITKKYYAECKIGSKNNIICDNITLYTYTHKILGYNQISSGHHTFPFTFTLRRSDSSTVRLNKKYKNKHFKIFNGYIVECKLKENGKDSFDELWNEKENVDNIENDKIIKDIVENVLYNKNTDINNDKIIKDNIEYLEYKDGEEFTDKIKPKEIISFKNDNSKKTDSENSIALTKIPFNEDSFLLHPRYFPTNDAKQENILEFKEYLEIFDDNDNEIISHQRLDISMCMCFFKTKVNTSTVTNKKLYFATENILLLTKISPKCEMLIHNINVTLIQLFSIKIQQNVHSFTKLMAEQTFSKNMGNGNWQTKIKIPRNTPSTVNEEYLKISYFLKVEVTFNRSSPVVINKKVDIFNREMDGRLYKKLDVLDGVEYPAVFFTLE